MIEEGQIWRMRGGFDRLRITVAPDVNGADLVCAERVDGVESFEYPEDLFRLIAWLEDSEPLADPDTAIIPGAIWHNTLGVSCSILIRVVRLIVRNGCDFVEYEDMREHARTEIPTDEFRASAFPVDSDDDESAI
jgi:hypothetical protein